MYFLSEQILQTVEVLPAEDQQQILDFVEFIWTKRQQAKTTEPETAERSFFEVAHVLIGAGEEPGDLSMNSDYMEGYGQIYRKNCGRRHSERNRPIPLFSPQPGA